mgnify:CR=1 FL=1
MFNKYLVEFLGTCFFIFIIFDFPIESSVEEKSKLGEGVAKREEVLFQKYLQNPIRHIKLLYQINIVKKLLVPLYLNHNLKGVVGVAVTMID